MRRCRLRRPRSRKWWGLFFFALLTINSYVLFDMLDVDGSQMPGWPGDDICTAQTLQAQFDRSLRGELPAPDLANLPPLALSRSGVMDGRGDPLSTINLRLRHTRVLPRVNLRREIAPANPLSADPA